MQKDNHTRQHHDRQQSEGAMNNRHYLRLLLMTVLSFVSMYVLMYAMVNTFANVESSLHGGVNGCADGADRTRVDGRDVSRQKAEGGHRRREFDCIGWLLFFDPAANGDCRPAVFEIHDSAPRRGHHDQRDKPLAGTLFDLLARNISAAVGWSRPTLMCC
jgi:hypothetical protein